MNIITKENLKASSSIENTYETIITVNEQIVKHYFYI